MFITTAKEPTEAGVLTRNIWSTVSGLSQVGLMPDYASVIHCIGQAPLARVLQLQSDQNNFTLLLDVFFL